MNCTRPAPVSVATVGAIQSVNNAACTTIGKMLSASEKYAGEATAVWHANHFAVFLFGQNQHNKLAIGILTETFAGAGGARAWADGIEVGGEIPNPISRYGQRGDRRIHLPDPLPVPPASQGFRRSGSLPRRRRHGIVFRAARCPGRRDALRGLRQRFEVPHERGSGGRFIPGSPNAYMWIKNNEAQAGNGENATHADTTETEQQVVDWGVFPLMGKDALYVRWNGGGGYGDPLLRPAEDVARDIQAGLTSPEFAQTVYGVVMDPGTGEADPSSYGEKAGRTGSAKKKRRTTRACCRRTRHLQTLRSYPGRLRTATGRKARACRKHPCKAWAALTPAAVKWCCARSVVRVAVSCWIRRRPCRAIRTCMTGYFPQTEGKVKCITCGISEGNH